MDSNAGTMKAPGPNIALTLSPKTPPRPKRRSSAFTYNTPLDLTAMQSYTQPGRIKDSLLSKV